LKFNSLDFKTIQLDIRGINLPEYGSARQNDVLKEIFPIIVDELIQIEFPVIYYFQICDEIDDPGLLTKLKGLYEFKYGDGKGKVMLPKITKNPTMKNSQKILYVGSRSKKFSGRILEHLGFSHHGTQGLNLCKIPNGFNSVKLHYAIIKTQNLKAVYLIENALHQKLKPLIGDSPSFG